MLSKHFLILFSKSALSPGHRKNILQLFSLMFFLYFVVYSIDFWPWDGINMVLMSEAGSATQIVNFFLFNYIQMAAFI